MKRICALAFLIFGTVLIGHAHAGVTVSSLMFDTPLTLNTRDKVFNLVVDFGATCNGIADDYAAYAAAGTAMRAYQVTNPHAPVTLVNTPGSTCTPITCPVQPFNGVENFTWILSRATMTRSCGGWGTGSWTAGGATQQFFNPNLVGDTCVTMTTPGTEVNYPVGNWVTVAGQGMQVESFPPNYANWEYAKVASTPAGQVCFTAPLVHAYPTTPIDLSLANCSNVYCGGPGKLLGLVPSWGGYWHIVRGTWFFPNQSGWNSRTVIMDNVTMTGGTPGCVLPSVIQTITYNNVNYPNCSVEVDKEIDQIIVNGGFFHALDFQSLSVNGITLNGGAHIFSMGGSPGATVCNDSTIDHFGMGTTYGTEPESFSGTNCAVTFFIDQAASNGFNPAPNQGSAAPHQIYWNGAGAFAEDHADIYGGLAQWDSAGGKLKMNGDSVSSTDNEITVGVPNIPGFVPGSPDQTIIYPVTPNFGATLPPGAAVIGWAADQARDMSCSGCSGNRLMSDLNFPAAQHQPVFTYANRTYTCANNIANIAGSYDINAGDGWSMAGAWVSAIINVSVADTNPADAGGPLLGVRPGNVFNTATGVVTGDPGGENFINLIHAGTRTILPASTSGAQAGDTLNAPGANSWMTGTGVQLQSPNITNGPAAQCPVVNVIWQTTR